MKNIVLVIMLLLNSTLSIHAQEVTSETAVESKKVDQNVEHVKDSLSTDDPNKFNFTYGEVKKIDFEAEVKDLSDEFNAIYILNRQNVFFYDYVGPEKYLALQSRIVHRRIRIENEEGLLYATKQIDMFKKEGLRKESLSFLQGATYNIIDGEIVKTELNEDAIFTTNPNEYYKSVSFTMPNVQVGSVIEYAYEIDSQTYFIDDIYLQYEIPVIHAQTDIDFPKRATYNVVFNPRSSYKLNFNPTVFDKDILSLKIKAEDEDEFGTDVETQQLRINGKTIGFSTKDIPALKPESLSGDSSKYKAKIMMNLAAILNDDGEVIEEFAVSWEDVATTIYDSDNFGRAIKSAGFYKNDFNNAIEGITDSKEKVNAIYNLVKSKVKWNGEYGVYSSDGLKDSYKKGSGKVSDINLLLISMLQKAELEAYPVLVSSLNRDIPIFPTIQGFNYVIAQVIIDGEKILLDATEKYARPGLIPLRAANWKGRLIKKDGSSQWVKLTENQKSKETVILNVSFNEDCLIKGNVKKRLSNYMALSSRKSNANATEEELLENLQNDIVGLLIEDVKVDEMESDDLYITYDYNITYKNGIDKIGDNLYITPLLYESNVENPFKLKTRELPLDLSYPIETKTIVNIDIPDGYVAASVPESVKFVYNTDRGFYKYVTKVIGQKITTIATFKLNQSVILPKDYVALKDFFESIVEKDAEKIVLKKI